jgi:hypothetical protein
MSSNLIPAGFDFLETIAKDTVFHFEKIPIPAGFFSNRSEPFAKSVNFRGRPLRGAYFGGLDITHVDTVVERKREVPVRRGVAARTPIELVGLALESVEPIEVEVGKRIELWDVEVELSAKRRSEGHMSITKADENGGTFDSEFLVVPVFRFIRRCDGKERLLDVGDLPSSPELDEMLTMRARRTPWRHTLITALSVEGLNDRFVAGAPLAINEESESADHGAQEARDCTVIIMGSRCLCAGATRPFTGRGSPGGGSYAWTITQGATRAAIVSGANQRTCEVRGLSTSRLANDIRLQVEYQAPGGATCRASIGLTTIDATLSFRRRGTLNDEPDNQTASDAPVENGWPQLGAVTPGNPPQCTGFRKNIEIKAVITPADASLTDLCAFDFKRTRQTIAGAISRDGDFTPNENHCPLGGCTDDITDNDEDLSMSAAGAIYVIDSPGIEPGACDDGAAGRKEVLCSNFTESLEVDGQRCGGILIWHAETRIECRGGTWVEYRGSVDPGHIQCGSAFVVGPSVTMPEALALLDSDSAPDRSKAHREIVGLLESRRLNKAERQELGRQLLTRAKQRRKPQGSASTVALAVSLLSSLRYAEAMPVFIDNLLTELGLPVSGNQQTLAAQAIANIGPPAIPAIVEASAAVGDKEWQILQGLLQLIEDQRLVRRSICSTLDADAGALAEERLDAYLQTRAARRGDRRNVRHDMR